MANTDGFGPWKRLFLPDDPPLFKNRKEGAPPRNIHAIQTGEIKSFFDYYLCRPASCFRFAEFDVSLKAFYALMPLLEPARKHADPEVRRWYEGFMELLAVSLVAKKDLSMLGCDTSEGEHEFHASRRMARAAEAVMRGFVDPGDKLCPLNPLPDPDTTWERWAMRVSPVNSWAFSRESFMVSKGTNPRIRTPSFIAHPELYKHSDDRWHSVWGYTVKGRFLPILKEKDPAAWSRLEAAQGDRKIFYAVLGLLEHPSPAARVRAAYVLANNSNLFDLFRDETRPGRAGMLKRLLLAERNGEARRYLGALFRAIVKWRGGIEILIKEEGGAREEWDLVKAAIREVPL